MHGLKEVIVTLLRICTYNISETRGFRIKHPTLLVD